MPEGHNVGEERIFVLRVPQRGSRAFVSLRLASQERDEKEKTAKPLSITLRAYRDAPTFGSLAIYAQRGPLWVYWLRPLWAYIARKVGAIDYPGGATTLFCLKAVGNICPKG